MCLKPLTLRNPTKFISRYGGQPLLIKVGCGKCAECVDTARQQWRFRAYKHSEHCINNGGFVYFDTLTYAPEHLPHLSDFVDVSRFGYDNFEDLGVSDFSTFNHNHFKFFLKRLRRQLDYHFTGSKFDYFLTSEYGTDERYTHRPHYHILFYVYPTANLDFAQFSRLVSQCWPYGRTDGIPYKPLTYVIEHTFCKSLNNEYQCKNKVCNYVSKYVTKDSTFRAELDKRIILLNKITNDKQCLKELIRQIDMFHRQSQGFGISYIDELDERDVQAIYDGYIFMEDDDRVICKIPTPMYYKRKLFYNNKKRDDNTRYWELNELGLEYHWRNTLHTIDRLSDKLYELYLNTSIDNKVRIQNYLAGRTLQNYACYLVLYKGRFIGETQLDYNLHRWLTTIQKSHFCNSSSHVYSVVDGYVVIPKELFLLDTPKTNVLHYNTFIGAYAINESTSPHFANFDKLTVLFDEIRKPLADDKQQAFDYKEDYNKRLKQWHQN